MWTIAKKEIKTYFLSPIGYIFIGLFLLIAGNFFREYILMSSNTFNYLYGYISMILMFMIPMLTMRTFSEERKEGTEQLLLTSPKSITSIVLGKFIGAFAMLLIATLLTLMYFVILMTMGKPDISTTLISMLGFLLLGTSYISFGMFASSITENQIVAAIISIVFLFATWYGFGLAGNTLDFIALPNMFNRFVDGQFSWNEVVAFVSYTIVFLLLTIIVIQRRKSVK